MTKRLLPLCVLVLAACAAQTRVIVVHPAPIYTEPQVVVAGEAVPAARVEDVPAAPSARHVWCRGYWHWTGTWEWVPGEWVVIKGGYRWAGPRYETDGPRVRYWRAHFRATGRGEVGERPTPGRPRPTPPEQAADEPTSARDPGAGSDQAGGQAGGQAGKPGDRGPGEGRPDEGEDRGKGKGKPSEGEDRGKGEGKPSEGEDRGKGEQKADEGQTGSTDASGTGEKGKKPKQTGHGKAHVKGQTESKGEEHEDSPEAPAGTEPPDSPPAKGGKKK